MTTRAYVWELRTEPGRKFLGTFGSFEEAKEAADSRAKRTLDVEFCPGYDSEDDNMWVLYTMVEDNGAWSQRDVFVCWKQYLENNTEMDLEQIQRVISAVHGEGFMRKHKTETARLYESKRAGEHFYRSTWMELQPEYAQPVGAKHPIRLRYSDAANRLFCMMMPDCFSTAIYSGRDSWDGRVEVQKERIEEGIKTFLNHKKNGLPIGIEDNGNGYFGITTDDIYFDEDEVGSSEIICPLQQMRSNIFVDADSVSDDVKAKVAAVLQMEKELNLSCYCRDAIPVEVYLAVTGNFKLLKHLEEGLK